MKIYVIVKTNQFGTHVKSSGYTSLLLAKQALQKKCRTETAERRTAEYLGERYAIREVEIFDTVNNPNDEFLKGADLR